MAAAKTTTKAPSSAHYVCNECETEFKGVECPDCGNRKANRKIAPDGIEQQLHKPEYIFGGSPNESREPDDYGLSDDYLLSVQNQKLSNEQFRDNLRESYVMNSEIKKLELEKKLYQKKKEFDRLKEGWEDTYAPNNSTPVDQSQQIPPGPLFGTQSPQSQFLSQLMKMDHEKRADFIEQLSDADPTALQSLSSMFAQPQQNPMYPQAGGYPPWMMPQQAPPIQQTDPTESAVALMTGMFDLMQKMQPKDNTSSELVRDLKDELKSLHTRIDTVIEKRGGNGGGSGMEPVFRQMKELEKRIEENQYRPSFSDQARELKSTIQDLETIGLVNNNTGQVTIDEKIRLKELDHKIELENRQITIDSDFAESEKAKQGLRENFAKQIFSRSLTPSKHEPEEEPSQPYRSEPPSVVHSINPIKKPRIIVDEIQSDSGQICEVRHSGDDD